MWWSPRSACGPPSSPWRPRCVLERRGRGAQCDGRWQVPSIHSAQSWPSPWVCSISEGGGSCAWKWNRPLGCPRLMCRPYAGDVAGLRSISSLPAFAGHAPSIHSAHQPTYSLASPCEGDTHGTFVQAGGCQLILLLGGMHLPQSLRSQPPRVVSTLSTNPITRKRPPCLDYLPTFQHPTMRRHSQSNAAHLGSGNDPTAVRFSRCRCVRRAGRPSVSCRSPGPPPGAVTHAPTGLRGGTERDKCNRPDPRILSIHSCRCVTSLSPRWRTGAPHASNSLRSCLWSVSFFLSLDFC